MPLLIRYVERKPSSFVSIEKVFREIASHLSSKYSSAFDQLPFSSHVQNLFANLIFFQKKPADIYHVTGHIHFMVLRLPIDRTVLTIHDLRFLYDHTGIKRAILKKIYLDMPVRRLKYITAISAVVRDEIVQHTGCDPNRIHVLDIPLFWAQSGSAGHDFNAAKPLILQIGTMQNKNIGNLAWALKGVSCRLVVIGRLTAPQIHALSESNVEYENFSEITDEVLLGFYQQADLITYCSTYEGFGLPIIEAQAMRKPVVTSNISPMKETAGPGACLVDPHDPGSIRAGIQKVINDEPFRLSIIEAGQQNIKRFAPKIVSGQYERLYDQIMDASGA